MPKYAVTLTGMFQVTADSPEAAYNSAVANLWDMMGEYYDSDDDHLILVNGNVQDVGVIPEDDEEEGEELV